MRMKKIGGRPTLPESQIRSIPLNIRLNLVESVKLQESAKAAGISVSEYARQAIIRGKIEPRISPETMGLIRRLCGMDNNLNQIARQANAAGYTDARSNYLHLANEMDNIIKEIRR